MNQQGEKKTALTKPKEALNVSEKLDEFRKRDVKKSTTNLYCKSFALKRDFIVLIIT